MTTPPPIGDVTFTKKVPVTYEVLVRPVGYAKTTVGEPATDADLALAGYRNPSELAEHLEGLFARICPELFNERGDPTGHMHAMLYLIGFELRIGDYNIVEDVELDIENGVPDTFADIPDDELSAVASIRRLFGLPWQIPTTGDPT